MTRQERAERTREVVVRAAAVCFDTAGFDATSLSDIVETAQVSKGALYFHFSSKEKLAEAVAAQSAAGWRGVLQAARAPGGPMLQVVIDTTHGVVRRIRHDVVFRAGLRLCDAGLPGAHRCPSPYPSWGRALGLMLARADRRGELLPGADLRSAADLLTTVTAGFAMLSRQDRDWLTARVVAGVWGVLLPALVPAGELDRFLPAGRPVPVTPVPRAPLAAGVRVNVGGRVGVGGVGGGVGGRARR